MDLSGGVRGSPDGGGVQGGSSSVLSGLTLLTIPAMHNAEGGGPGGAGGHPDLDPYVRTTRPNISGTFS